MRSTQQRYASDLLVRHLRKPEHANSLNDYEVLAELPLLEDLREFTWEFYEVEKKRWVTLWEDRSGPPLFRRLRFSFAHEPRETRYEYAFWISGGDNAVVAASQQGGGS